MDGTLTSEMVTSCRGTRHGNNLIHFMRFNVMFVSLFGMMIDSPSSYDDCLLRMKSKVLGLLCMKSKVNSA